MRQRRRALWLALSVLACSGEKSEEFQNGDAGAQGRVDAGRDDSGLDPGDGGDGVGVEADLRGRVLSLDGVPVSGVTLRLGGQTVQTDPEGRFAARSTVPYDLVLISGTDTYAFLDVTRLDPTLRIGISPASKSAQVQGAIGGAVSFPLGSGDYIDTTFVGGPGLFSDRLNPGSNAGGYGPLEVRWEKGDALPGYLVSVLSHFDGERFSEPLALAVKPLSLTNGGEVGPSAETELELVTASLRTITVAANVPDGYVLDRANHSLGTYRRAVLNPTLPFDLQVADGLPADLPQGLGFEFLAADGNLVRTNLEAGSVTRIDLDVPNGTRAISPADGATAGSDDAMTFTAQEDGITLVNFEWEEGNPDVEGVTGYRVQVALDDTTLALARVRALDIALPSSLTWRLAGVGPWADIDAYLGADAAPPGTWYDSYTGNRRLTLSP